MPPTPLDSGTKQKSAKYTLKLRIQIIMKHACGRGLRYLAFYHILISFRVEVAQTSDFLVHAKILPL